MTDQYDVVGSHYSRESEVPKDDDLFYRCDICETVIPSLPDHSLGCQCGNIFIDMDSWRFVVGDLAKLTVLRKKPAGAGGTWAF